MIIRAICGKPRPVMPGRGETFPHFSASVAVQVGQPAKVATCGKLTVAFVPSGRFPVALASFAICEPVEFPTVGVGQPLSGEPEPLPDVRRAEARRAGIDRPAGVIRSFQVSLYKVEPSEAVLARNLLAKDDWRAALSNEVEPGWP